MKSPDSINPRDQLRRWLTCARIADRHYTASARPPEMDSGNRLKRIAIMLEEAPAYHRRLKYVHDQQWQAATEEARKDNWRFLRRLRDLIDEQIEATGSTQNRPAFHWTRTELIRDLCVIEQQFPRVCFEPKGKQLTVTTHDIRLENLDLGAFDIVLNLDTLSTETCAHYEVVAVDANLAGSNDDETHPHVQGNQLCEGEAQPTIKMALQQGRLLDFFQIVEQVLQTYNASSAYVTVEDWRGQSCGHCGCSVSDDDLCGCSGCSADICSQCVYSCVTCDAPVCGNCDRSCDECSDLVCGDCSVTCPGCDGDFCKTCLTQNERCDSCEKETKQESNAVATEPEVHGERLGTVAVLA